MFENLSDKLQRSFKTLRGQGTISDENISDAVREIRLALLESDVNLTVVNELVEHIRTRAIGEKVATALSPSEQIVKIVHDELINVLGKDTARFQKSSQPPSVILMAGLQGSGKTTTSGKARPVVKKSRPPPHARLRRRLPSRRPRAARHRSPLHQLPDLRRQANRRTSPAPTPSSASPKKPSAKPPTTAATCSSSTPPAATRSTPPSWTRWPQLKKLLNPSEILFVADAMTGQDAVNSAKAFNDLLTITGAILTKMDGDARGGAALSIRHVTGAPIKFLGTGEKPDAFEPFHPDRIVSRIMGHGDIATLIERAEEKLDRGKAEQFAKKALSGDGFSLEDFRDQLRQIKKMGSMKSILKMLPSVGPFAGMQQAVENVDEGQFTRVESIINSMTQKERLDHEIINGNRRKRIARGSGTTVQDVNNLLRQYAQMRKMFKSMGSGGGIKAQQRLMSQMQGRQKFGR